MRFDVVTLFPEMFPGYLGQSLLKLAIERGLVDVQLHNLRDWAPGKHHQVDDRPFGGGAGMVLRVDVVVEAVEAVRQVAQTSAYASFSSRTKFPLEITFSAGAKSRRW
jgi:tRNA (guanine37-N1)-methyltransferase